ncbi:MAG: hypothetical protein ABJK37_01420 [Paraglaciecola sp.]|uniref:PKD domain-containing protein n=1 Tax=Paraglaciecola sp. TaxID=1920173 RepID=UPI003299D9AA
MKVTSNLCLILIVLLLLGCGGSGGSKSSPTPTNLAPSVDAGDVQSVSPNSDVTLSASATDSDGSIVSYSWTQTVGDAVSMSGADSSSLSFTAPLVSSNTTLTFRLTVTDNEGATSTDTVNINIEVMNDAPVVEAGTDQTVEGNTLISLNGSASDTESEVTVVWTQISGTNVVLSDNTVLTPTFMAPQVTFSEELIFSLVATDNQGATTEDSISIIITPPVVSDTLVPTGTWRAERLTVDYDANGIAEGRIELDYDTANRIVLIQQNYLDDGFEDHPLSMSAGMFRGFQDESVESEIVYDNSNRIIEQTQVQGAQALDRFYEYAEDLVVSKMTIVSYSTSEENPFEYTWTIAPVYSGNFVQSYEAEKNSELIRDFNGTLTYDEQNRVISEVAQYQDDERLVTYVWNSNNTLAELTVTYDTELINQTIYTYGSDGSMSSIVSNTPTYTAKLVTTTFSYNTAGLLVLIEEDLDSDGNVDKKIEIVWEQQPCVLSGGWGPETTEVAAQFNIPALESLPEGTELGTNWAWNSIYCQ